MQRIKKENAPWPSPMAVALMWALACSAVLAESSAPTAPTAPTAPRAAPTAAQPLTLPALFERAWARQPEAQSSALRREAAQAARNGAASWTAEPVALEMQAKTDRPGSNQGSREVEVGLAMPLWLPGERVRKAALGDAEIRAVESRRLAAQLKLAASVREAWWAFQRAQGEWGLAQDRLLSAQRLAADVARRFKAGDMSRADQHQADGAVAQAQAAVAQAALTGWTGGTFDSADTAHTTNGNGSGPGALVDSTTAEPLAETMPGAALSADHPAVADWPTRLRVELEAAQAERQLARARIDAAAAISTLRQAMGLLPQ